MGILNYSTKISPQITAGELSGKLAMLGAKQVTIDYDERGLPIGISFVIQITRSLVQFRLPCKWEGVLNAMKKDRSMPRSFHTEDQARRVAWRIVKDWVEAQMAIIQAETAELAEVFLPYAVNPKTGQTLFQTFNTNPQYLLGVGDEIVEGHYNEVEDE